MKITIITNSCSTFIGETKVEDDFVEIWEKAEFWVLSTSELFIVTDKIKEEMQVTLPPFLYVHFFGLLFHPYFLQPFQHTVF